MIQFLHQRQQQTDLAGREALASEPIEIPAGQVGDQPAFVLAVRHDAGNQQLQVFVIHPNTQVLLIRSFAIIEYSIIHYTVHPEVSKGGLLRQPWASIPQPERGCCRKLWNAQ